MGTRNAAWAVTGITLILCLGATASSQSSPAIQTGSIAPGAESVNQGVSPEGLELAPESGGVAIDQEWEDEFTEIVQTLRERSPRQYVHAEIFSSLDKSGEIVFNARPSESMLKSLERLGSNVTVTVAPGSLSEAELSALTVRVYRAVEEQVGYGINVGASPSPVKNEIRIILPQSQATTVRPHAIESAIADVLSDAERKSLDIVFEYNGTEESGSETIVGGSQLRVGTQNYCTAGFAVTRGSGASQQQGFVTAGHCSPANRYVAYGGGGTSVIHPNTVLNKNQGDMMVYFITDGRKATNRVHTGASATTTISGYSNPAVGTTYSFYGRTTGSSSDRVRKLNQCWGGYCGLVQNHSHKTSGGDSGGPWRTSNRAAGVHYGWMPQDGANRSLFTPSRQAVLALNVAYRTSP